MKKLTFTLLLATGMAATAFAQREFFALAWEINVPTNSNYLTEASFAGGKAEYRKFVSENMSFGLAWNWASYEQYFDRRTYEKADGSAAITSDFVAQVYQVPITATAHYYWKGNKKFRPYAGIALGGQYMEQRLYYNIYESNEYNWGFVARPEIGTLIKLQPAGGWAILLAANYSYATNENALTGKNSFKNLGFTIGFAFGE